MRIRKSRKKRADPILWSRQQIENKPNLVVPAILTSSYIYYCREDLPPIMEDEDFDWACKFMLKNFRSLDHPHKSLIKRSHLRAGTLFDFREARYPTIAKVTAVGLAMGDLHLHATVQSKPAKRKTRKRRTVTKRTRRERTTKSRSGFLSK